MELTVWRATTGDEYDEQSATTLYHRGDHYLQRLHLGDSGTVRFGYLDCAIPWRDGDTVQCVDSDGYGWVIFSPFHADAE